MVDKKVTELTNQTALTRDAVLELSDVVASIAKDLGLA